MPTIVEMMNAERANLRVGPTFCGIFWGDQLTVGEVSTEVPLKKLSEPDSKLDRCRLVQVELPRKLVQLLLCYSISLVRKQKDPRVSQYPGNAKHEERRTQ